MRKVERFVRKRLKEGYAPERIRKEILEGCLTKRWGDNHRVSHWATDIPYSWCGCKETFYCNTKKIHFTEVECKRARVCLCVDNETGEIIHHCKEPLSEHINHGTAKHKKHGTESA